MNNAKEVAASEITVSNVERGNGIVKMWDVIGRFGHYVIQLTDRGFKGYQIEVSDSAGERNLEFSTVSSIVEYFQLA